MKSTTLALLALAAIACADNVLIAEAPVAEHPTAYGYLEKYAIPLGKKLRKAEEEFVQISHRIIGGLPAAPGQYPWKAGLLIRFQDLDGTGVCGGSLISDSRVVTAAHCWYDGRNQAWLFEVVLGSVLLFSGGTRVPTSSVAVHPNWFPLLARNDVAIAYLPTPIATFNVILPISLPRGSELLETYAGEKAFAAGFGLTSDNGDITSDQFLSHVPLNIIQNSVCQLSFPLNLQPSNICTSGVGGVGTCQGDSGGPLVVYRDRPILVGITSFGSALGCESPMPAVYARVTSFIDFINRHL